ncbi:hypothetical protein GALL_388980 [mine drainage metagenome]|uniref:DUF4440 domain-containing protein n=1 Tax=mine drainage metagenome TaxID=410659 RepID=A0A1J5QH85_9ZZZZ
MEPTFKTLSHLVDIQDQLSKMEPIFHHPEYGDSREALEQMTDESFWEVGASGRRYSRKYIIDTVLQRQLDAYEENWQAQDFYCQEIAQDNYLLTYTLHQSTRVTRRSTLWRRTSSGWKIVYHQGTVVT